MKTNSIYEAIGNVDDRLVTEAAAARRKRPVALIIAASAAALTLITGAVIVGNRNSTFSIGEDVAFNMELKKHGITIPEEYMPTAENKYSYSGVVDIGVEELFDKFNAPLLINENFSADIDTEAADIVPWTYSNLDTGVELEVKGKPFIDVNLGAVTFAYYLYDKNIDRNVYFWADYLTDNASDDYAIHDGVGGTQADYEVLRLRDGSSCYVGAGNAEFSFNGVKYSIDLGNGERTVELTKQVLADLDVL